MMKHTCIAAALFAAGFFTLSAAEPQPVAVVVEEPVVVENVSVPYPMDEMRPTTSWTPFDVVFIPTVPKSSWNSNCFGIKSGWPATGGIGRVWGLEASWVYSGTAHIKGIQASWVHNQNKTCDGLQASWVSCINFEQLNGIQATMVFCMAGDVNGLQASLVSLAGNVQGLQAALGFNMSKDVTGFQAAGVNVVDGKFTGVQCGLYSQVKECSGLQLGIVNVSGKGGLQFGLLNFIKDAWIPVFPIFNFSF